MEDIVFWRETGMKDEVDEDEARLGGKGNAVIADMPSIVRSQRDNGPNDCVLETQKSKR
jgi:hypothetical protein